MRLPFLGDDKQSGISLERHTDGIEEHPPLLVQLIQDSSFSQLAALDHSRVQNF